MKSEKNNVANERKEHMRAGERIREKRKEEDNEQIVEKCDGNETKNSTRNNN